MKKLLICLLPFLLASCVSAKFDPQVYQQARKVAVANNVTNDVGFTSLAIIAFGNECRHINLDSWGLSQKVANKVVSQIRSTGKEVQQIGSIPSLFDVWAGLNFTDEHKQAATKVGADLLMVIEPFYGSQTEGAPGACLRGDDGENIAFLVDKPVLQERASIGFGATVYLIDVKTGKFLIKQIMNGLVRFNQDKDEWHGITIFDPIWDGSPTSTTTKELNWQPTIQDYSPADQQLIRDTFNKMIATFDISPLLKAKKD